MTEAPGSHRWSSWLAPVVPARRLALVRIAVLLFACGWLFANAPGLLQRAQLPIDRFVPVGIARWTGPVASSWVVVGVVLARVATHKASRDVDVVSANIEAIETSLGRIVEKARNFERDKDNIDVYELRHHIDRRGGSTTEERSHVCLNRPWAWSSTTNGSSWRAGLDQTT